MVKKGGRRKKLPVGSIPTYIRFMETQLDLMDCALEERKFHSRSEFTRDAVKRLLSSGDTAIKAR